MHAGERLRKERERLGFSQKDFAALVPVTRKTLFNWESGAGHAATDALAIWAGVGLDVLYVITALPLAEVGAGLGARQLALLARFDAADEAGRLAIERAVLALEGQPAPA
ncbi:MAG: helix-turn-helix domain-containing protein [Curvibacter sp.]|nr:helix-turn-helix domain-containing protein [Curvibacter sp.]